MRPGSNPRANQMVLSETWEKIKRGMDACFHERSMKRSDWMDLQTQVYNLAVDTSMGPNEGPSGSSARPSSRSNKKDATTNKKCAEVYEKVKSYLNVYLQKISEECRAQPEEDMLMFYKRKWESYIKAASTVDGLFEYVNRTYVQRQKDQNSPIGSFIVNDLALVAWRETFYFSLKNRITSALFQLIKKERSGEQINTTLVYNVLQSLVTLSIPNPWEQPRAIPAHVGSPSSANTFQSHSPHHQINSAGNMGGIRSLKKENDNLPHPTFFYKDNFEDDFIRETEFFYRAESEKFIREHSFTEYMAKSEARFEEEKFRVSKYLHPQTERPLIKCCEDILITAHIERFYQEYAVLLRDHKVDDLSRLYSLCVRVKDALEKLQDMFQVHVNAKGVEAMQRVTEEVERSKGAAGKSELPKLFAEGVISVHKQFTDLIQKAFADNSHFVTALDMANEQYINRNPVTVMQAAQNQQVAGGAPGQSKSGDPAKTAAELLAQYIDSLLRVSSRKSDDNDLDEHMQDSMMIFKYISEKDVFARQYSRHLANRLVNGSSVSDDAEQSMIEKLKGTCGFEYTNKFQKMFTDVNLSKKLSEEFKKPPATMEFDFSIIVGTSASWPFNNVKGYILPKEFQATFEKFKMFYNQKHNNRKLDWQWNRCKGEIATGCFQRTYVFVASMYQMGVLLLFNKSATLTMGHIIHECGIPNSESSIQVIQQLVKMKILSSNGDEKDETTEITVSENYHNKKVKVPITMPIKAEQRQDRQHTDRQVEEDRKNVIQAAIVRIMKMRKRLNHNSVVQETIEQVRTRFQPSVASIKKEIDALIEKEFLKRAENERNVYEYVA
ncbi:cullin-1-like [Convolutriloba macropyga]|uniref:cullin-1-like n=1 Tax=Convolutriloba macropyga TaxID=536237 RepID=UPI003F52504D